MFPHYADQQLAEFPMIFAVETNLGNGRLPFPRIPRHHLIEEIMYGASGVVFIAKHDLENLVAIKIF